MDSLTDYITQVRMDVDARLEELLPTEDVSPSRLHAAMRYSVFAGGRRFRPTLCIASCQALGGAPDAALVPACAIEVLHTYTLIHDDLPSMDNDDMRRGKPSNHKQFDEGTAILAGDALLTLAFELLSKTGNTRFAAELASATGSLGTVGGQQDDLDSKGKKISQSEVLAIHTRKTAALFRVSCMMGAIAAGASESDIEQMGQFGEYLGMAFQLLDDVCDNDEVTMNAFERDEALELARSYEDLSYEVLEKLQGDVSILKELAEYTYASFVV